METSDEKIREAADRITEAYFGEMWADWIARSAPECTECKRKPRDRADAWWWRGVGEDEIRPMCPGCWDRRHAGDTHTAREGVVSLLDTPGVQARLEESAQDLARRISEGGIDEDEILRGAIACGKTRMQSWVFSRALEIMVGEDTETGRRIRAIREETLW